MKVERTQAAVIKRAAERANRLIQDLLDITHIESGRLSLDRERARRGVHRTRGAGAGRP